MREVCASAETTAGALGANNEHVRGHEMKHATNQAREKRCSTFRDSPHEAMLLFLDDMRRPYGSVEKYVRTIGVTADQFAATHRSTAILELWLERTRT
jgi:hypothetical protein